jgi:hypothetical protein
MGDKNANLAVDWERALAELDERGFARLLPRALALWGEYGAIRQPIHSRNYFSRREVKTEKFPAGPPQKN